MEKSVVVKASNVELAVEKALAELEATRDRVRVEVLQKGGLFQRAEVRVTLKETAETLAEDFVNGVLAAMNIKARGKAEERDGEIVVDIEGEDGGSAIGYRGEVLDAIQFLTRTYVGQERNGSAKIVVDCENYRAKRTPHHPRRARGQRDRGDSFRGRGCRKTRRHRPQGRGTQRGQTARQARRTS